MNLTTTPHRRRAVLTLLCAVALVAGCGGGQDPAAEPGDGPTTEPVAASPSTPGQEQGAEDVVIVISDFAYEVPETVAAGAEVTVTNEDSVGHTVTSDDDGVFDVAVGPGETVTFTAPQDPGEYGFFCIPHPQMTDTLVVG